MGDAQRIAVLRKVLAKQIAWYKEYDAKEKSGEVDSSYVYDCAEEQFSDLSRGDFGTILEVLVED